MLAMGTKPTPSHGGSRHVRSASGPRPLHASRSGPGRRLEALARPATPAESAAGVGPPCPRRLTTGRPIGPPASGQPQVPLSAGPDRSARPGARLRPAAADRGDPLPPAGDPVVAPAIGPRFGPVLSQPLPRRPRDLARPL